MEQDFIDGLARGFLNAADVESGEDITVRYDQSVAGAIIERFSQLAAEKGVSVRANGRSGQYPNYSISISSGKQEDNRMLYAAVPHVDLAADFNMQAQDFQRYALNVYTLDYKKLTECMQPLRETMSGEKEVKVTGFETDLTLELEDIEACAIAGVYNLPDGECFSAPKKKSINGTIRFGPSSYDGEDFEWMKLTYVDGRVMEAVAEDKERTEALNRILDIDKGARYAGEFALGVNPYMLHPIGSILFDEKITGSLHIAQGHCLERFAPNENRSSKIHWDMVHIQRPEYGGGDLYFDGKLIRRDGLFVPRDLRHLNPEGLKRIVGPNFS